ncbi:hypothetical protein [Acidisoma sp.]|uniref:hypothetical protein n=1 Tax=Acidisoma sp. TaxID=1872115 RepID=UPI003B00A643
MNVSELARRWGVNRGLLQTWRREAIGMPVGVPRPLCRSVWRRNRRRRAKMARRSVPPSRL